MGRLHKHILCGNCPNYTPSPLGSNNVEMFSAHQFIPFVCLIPYLLGENSKTAIPFGCGEKEVVLKQPSKPDQEKIKICNFSFLDTHSSKNDFAFGNQNFVGQYFLGFILSPPNRPYFCFSSELSVKNFPTLLTPKLNHLGLVTTWGRRSRFVPKLVGNSGLLQFPTSAATANFPDLPTH